MTPPPSPPKSEPVPAPKKTGFESDLSARLTVELPADAKLFVDGFETTTTGASIRTFSTPELEAGQDYFYVLKIETNRDGKTIAETKQVTVRAGEETRASFIDAKVVNASQSN
jgi:uncharacterized protein (TIGR03000 family)